jgi:hypothetical protein
MASVTRSLAALALVATFACSPEARRVRDGGPGADIGNKRLVVRSEVDPRAADTTLWPGRDPAPVERLARGEEPQLAPRSPPGPPRAGKGAEQRSFSGSRRANPRRQRARQ